MAKREITISTRLQLNNEVTDYLEAYLPYNSQIKREMWQEMTNPKHNERFESLADYKKYCRSHYSLLGRTVNSLVIEVQGMMDSYMELKKTELAALEIRISDKQDKIQKIKEELDSMKDDLARNISIEKNLRKYHNLKQSLYWQKNRLNRMKQQRTNLNYQIENKIYSLCFGTKETFSKQYRLEENGFRSHEGWYNYFVRCRDKNILYVGANNESIGNQMFHLYYDSRKETFSIEVRKEDRFCMKGTDKYVRLDGLTFKYRADELKSILRAYERNADYNSPLTYRFHKAGKKWYLQVMFSAYFDDEYESRTTSKHGTIGLDYNDGFIEATETDESGNAIKRMHFDLKYHGTGDKAETEIRQVVSQIVKYAEQRCKDLGIEDLDFKKTKAKQSSSTKPKDKNYNRMLHKFDYGRYKQTIKNIAFNHRVRLVMVNPAYTSKTGKRKYADTRKMTVHQAASFVIARKIQGYDDVLKKSTKIKKAV